MNRVTKFASEAQVDDVQKVAHLSEDQVDEQLMGDLDDVAAAHLAECAQCSERVAEAAEPMATFRDVTMAWSERRSATMPLPVVDADALVWQRRAGWAMAACALVVGISIGSNGRKAEMLRTSEQTASMTMPRAVSVPVSVDKRAGDVGTQDVSAQYSGDNRMLKAIDSELDASMETPAAMGLETVSDQPRSQTVPTSVED